MRKVLYGAAIALVMATGAVAQPAVAPPTPAAVAQAIVRSLSSAAPTAQALAASDVASLVRAIESGIVSAGATPSIALQSINQIDVGQYPGNVQLALNTEAGKLLRLLQADARYTGSLGGSGSASSGGAAGGGGGVGTAAYRRP